MSSNLLSRGVSRARGASTADTACLTVLQTGRQPAGIYPDRATSNSSSGCSAVTSCFLVIVVLFVRVCLQGSSLYMGTSHIDPEAHPVAMYGVILIW